MNLALAAIGVMRLLPQISQTILDVEQLDSSPNKGAAKRALVLSILRIAYEATVPAVPFDDLKATIEKTIAALVEFYNAIGTFIKAVPAV